MEPRDTPNTRPVMIENHCTLLLQLIGELRFNVHFQRYDHEQRRRVEAAQARITEALAEPISLDQVAAELHVSLRQLQRDFVAFTGMTPGRYRNIMRLSEANTMLSETSLPIAEIAARLGYANLTHFSAAFRQVYHCSPRQVRDAIRGVEAYAGGTGIPKEAGQPEVVDA